MVNQPETSKKWPPGQQEKLVLPAPLEEDTPAHAIGSLHITKPIPPGYLIHRESAPPPQNPVARLRCFWHKDSAYKVLLIALAMVLVAGTAFFSLIGNALAHSSNLFAASSTLPQAPPTASAPRGAVNLRLSFAPPGGGKGSTTSSQPSAQAAPYLQATPSPQNSPTPGGGTLTVQITDIPTAVQNNQPVTVGVTTSEPDVTVSLDVNYNAVPHNDTAGPVASDANGNATLNWMVTVSGARKARATVVAIAKDQNGQQAQSSPVRVRISGNGSGD